MKILTPIRLFTFALLASSISFAQAKPAKSSLLPQAFSGFAITGQPKTSTDAKTVDPAQGAALKEYGFTDSENASYSNGDNKLTLKAARFQDATGAYGAFTFYRQPQMKTETIGNMAVSDNNRVLFFKSNILVEADFDHLTAMSAAALRDLADQLPVAQGPTATLPSLPNYMPRANLVPNTGKYILGPVAYAATGLQISPQLIDFNRGPELLTSKVQTQDGTADFTLINYPTPQIAIDRLKVLQTANPQGQNATYAVKRSGPIVAIVSGAISEQNAKTLLGMVNYQAEVTWNENTGLSKRDNIGNLVIAGILLAGIIFSISVVTGTIFGFGRVFLRKILPARFAPKEEQGELIRLHLEE